MKSDINKAIENISYNHHNQSSEVDFGYFDKLSNQKTVYTCTATGKGEAGMVLAAGFFTHHPTKNFYLNMSKGHRLINTGYYEIKSFNLKLNNGKKGFWFRTYFSRGLGCVGVNY